MIVVSVYINEIQCEYPWLYCTLARAHIIIITHEPLSL